MYTVEFAIAQWGLTLCTPSCSALPRLFEAQRVRLSYLRICDCTPRSCTLLLQSLPAAEATANMKSGNHSRLEVIIRASGSTADAAKFAITAGVVQFSELLEIEVEDIEGSGFGAALRLAVRRTYKALQEEPSSPPACLTPTSTTAASHQVQLPAFETVPRAGGTLDVPQSLHFTADVLMTSSVALKRVASSSDSEATDGDLSGEEYTVSGGDLWA